MNAYELADELAFKHIAGDESGAFNSKLIVMLRQQADRIAELEKFIPVNAEITMKWDDKTTYKTTTPQTKSLHEDIIYGLCYKYGIEKGDVLEFGRAIEERIRNGK
jgi:hypothetical protein